MPGPRTARAPGRPAPVGPSSASRALARRERLRRASPGSVPLLPPPARVGVREPQPVLGSPVALSAGAGAHYGVRRRAAVV